MDNRSNVDLQPNFLPSTLLSEDGPLKYDFRTSLQNIAIAKIVTNLWASENIQQEIEDTFDVSSGFHDCLEFYSDRRDIKWKTIENNVISKVETLLSSIYMTRNLKEMVPLVGREITRWIRYIDRYVLNTDESSKYAAADLIRNISFNTLGKIDYAKTAKNILADQGSPLSDDHKYKTACSHCLEEEISAIAVNVLHPEYLDGIFFDKHPMVYWWTSLIAGDDTKLHNPKYYYHFNRRFDDEDVNEHIIRLLRKKVFWKDSLPNETAIRYMWERLTAVKKVKNLISLIEYSCQAPDITLSLLSNLDYEQQRQVFQECSGSILRHVFDDWPSRAYCLPVALHLLNYIKPSDYYRALSMINEAKNNSKNKNEYNAYKFILLKLWQKGSRRLKDAFTDNGKYGGMPLIYSLSWETDADIIQSVFSHLNTHQKKSILHYKDAEFCAKRIVHGEWNLLELFLMYTDCSKEDLSQIKQTLINYRGVEIIEHFLKEAELDKIKYFMVWVFNDLTPQQTKNIFQSDGIIKVCDRFIQSGEWSLLDMCTSFSLKEDIWQLKRSLLNYGDVGIAGHVLRVGALENLEYFINWFFESEQKCNEFRLRFAYAESECILESIFTNNVVDFRLLVDCFQWCIKCDPAEINELDAKVILIHYVQWIFMNAIECHRYELLDQVLIWCFSSNQRQIEHFKTQIPKSCIKRLIIRAIEEDRYEELDRVLDWCFNKKEQIEHFRCNMYKAVNYVFEDIVSLTFCLMKQNSSFKLLDKYTEWSFTNGHEKQVFKSWLLYSCTYKYEEGIFDLLDQYTLADRFFHWCLPSSEAVNDFKNTLMRMDDAVEYVIYLMEREVTPDYLKSLIIFFNPTKETVVKFKALISELILVDSSTFFYSLLDEVMESL